MYIDQLKSFKVSWKVRNCVMWLLLNVVRLHLPLTLLEYIVEDVSMQFCEYNSHTQTFSMKSARITNIIVSSIVQYMGAVDA